MIHGRNPKVSVIMAVYNDEAHLGEAVESVLGQSFTDFELIVIEDGSTDGSLGVMETFPDERLKVIRQHNQGLTPSLIRASALALGDYLARQDSDDISEKDRLEEQVAFLESHPEVALVGTYAALIDADGQYISTRRLETRPGIEHGRLEEQNQFVHGSLLFRRTAFDEVGGYREFFRYSQDYDLVLRMAERWQVANLPKVHYRHRMRPNEVSIMHNREQAWYRDMARALHRERMTGMPDRIQSGLLTGGPDEDLSVDVDYVDLYRVRHIYTCLRAGMVRNARKEILNRLKSRPLQAKAYLHLGLTFLDGRVTAALLRTWDRIRRTDPG